MFDTWAFLREPLLGSILEYTGEAVPCLGSVDLSFLRPCGNSEFSVRRYPVEEKLSRRTKSMVQAREG